MTASLLAIDLGTARIKFGVLDDDGTYRLVQSADGQTVFPEPGGAIQEPDRIMRACIDGLKQCAPAIRCPAGLVLTGQMGGPIIVAERGAALTEWITAMDSRCRDSSRALKRAAGSRIRRISTSVPFQAERIHWIQQSRTLPESCWAFLPPAYVATQLAAEGRRASFCERTCAGWSGLADVVALRWDDELAATANGWTQRLDGQKVVDLAEGACDGPAVMARRRRPGRIYSGRRKSVRCRGPGTGSDGPTPARRDNQPGSARSGALKETLATLSAGAPDASRVERDRCVKLLDGNTWPMS
jgi:glycerol kinase